MDDAPVWSIVDRLSSDRCTSGVGSLYMVNRDGRSEEAIFRSLPMHSDVSFGHWLKQRRKSLDMTQADLARQVGCAVITIRKIESGVLRPSLQIARRMAEYLDLPPTDRAAFVQVARGALPLDRLVLPQH